MIFLNEAYYLINRHGNGSLIVLNMKTEADIGVL